MSAGNCKDGTEKEYEIRRLFCWLIAHNHYDLPLPRTLLPPTLPFALPFHLPSSPTPPICDRASAYNDIDDPLPAALLTGRLLAAPGRRLPGTPFTMLALREAAWCPSGALRWTCVTRSPPPPGLSLGGGGRGSSPCSDGSGGTGGVGEGGAPPCPADPTL
jgi:hypothetical protein